MKCLEQGLTGKSLRRSALPFSLWRKITKDISLIKARCNKECSLVLSRCLCKTYQSYWSSSTDLL